MNKKKLLIIYVAASMAWIFGTNFLIEAFSPESLAKQLEQAKEIFYVIITGCFFYFFVSKSEQLSAAKEEERRLSTLINSMVDFVNFKDGQGRWIEANDYGLKLFQLEGVDYRGKKDSELAEYSEFYGDALKYCEVSDEETWRQGTVSHVEEILPAPDGTSKTFDTIKVPLFHPDGSRKGLVVIGRDVTEKRRVKKLLEESEQRYKSLFDYNPDIVYMLDLDGVITNLNPQFFSITGYETEQAIGKPLNSTLPKAVRQDVYDCLSAVIADKQPQSYEFVVRYKNGHPVRLYCVSVPMMINGEIAGVIGYAKDITTVRETEERLRKTEKLSVVGELSASVAHEIRNPLTSLKGFVQLLQVEDEKHLGYYQIMLAELNRINHIVSELLLLAKPQQVKYTKADIGSILNDVISLLKTEASLYNVEIEFLPADNCLEIECEPNQLKQLFINLIKNAIEASRSGEAVVISVAMDTNNSISISVKDSGCGISKEMMKRLGEPFYSSKEKGTGLGLTVSFKIVQSHHGTILFNSESNKGTEVLIKLPVNGNHSMAQANTRQIYSA